MSEDESDVSKLYMTYDEKGNRLFTPIPNALLMARCGAKMSAVEMRIIDYIARMTYGFQGKEETCYLGADDFKEYTGIQKTHFSTTIRKMLKAKTIFRGMKSGDKYKYAINLLTWGYPMKYYRIVNEGYKLSNKEYTFDDESYAFSNKADVNNDTIVYKSDGYDNEEKPHIKKDRNSNKKLDTKDDSVDNASASRFGAPSTEAVKSKSSTVTKSTGPSFNGATAISATNKDWADKQKQLEALLIAFEEEILQWDTFCAIPIMVKHMHILKDAGFPAGEISIRWNKILEKHQTDIKGKAFILKDWNEAMRTYEKERKEKGLSS